jgi:hypothetical protein
MCHRLKRTHGLNAVRACDPKDRLAKAFSSGKTWGIIFAETKVVEVNSLFA